MGKEAIFKLNNRRLAEAKLARLFKSKIFEGALILLSVAGLMVLVFAILLLVPPFTGLSYLSTLLWFVAFVGLVSFWLANISAFLNEKELKVRATEVQKDLGVCADFGATIFLSEFAKKKFDFTYFVANISKNPEVKFVLAELNPNDHFWGYLRAGSGVMGYTEKLLKAALEKAQTHNSPLVSAADLFWGAMVASENYDKLLSSLEIEESDLENIFFLESRIFQAVKYPPTITEKLRVHTAGIAQSWDSGYTLFLDRFARPVWSSLDEDFSIEGRAEAEEEIETVLTKQNKNNVILVGQAGVGKSTLIKAVVAKIAWGTSLPALKYQRVMELDLGAVIAHAGDRAELEQVLIGIFNDAVRAGNIILYVPQIQDLFSGGTKEGTIDASEIILPYLSGSSLRIIGATSEKAFETYIEPKSQLASQFTKVAISPTEKNETLRVMAEVSVSMGETYGVSIAYSALKEAYVLAEHYVTEKEFPGKAIDILENICSAARNHNLKLLDRGVVAQLSEKVLNIKAAEASADEKTKLLNLESEIHARVIGQIEAVNAVADAMRRARAQVKDEKRPIGSFLFMGPTGVGKTELAKALAAAYFGDEKKMIRMDMNEFQDAAAISRFIGQKSQTQDELEGGEFVKHVRANPFSVVLLDEIEKANPSILDLFLQALDEGYITDGVGERVNLNGTIIIATSNAGANSIRKMVEVGSEYQKIKEEVIEEVQNSGTFKPEFLNRFDGVIIFRPLSAKEILEVAELDFRFIQTDFKSKGYDIELAPGVLEKLAQEGYVPEMGARPMRRVFQDRLQSFLAKKMLEDAIPKSEPFVVNVSDLY